MTRRGVLVAVLYAFGALLAVMGIATLARLLAAGAP